jgi:hypothetical protein
MPRKGAGSRWQAVGLDRRLIAWVILAALGAAPAVAAEIRNIDGSGNNRKHPEWGSAGVPLIRVVPSDYTDDMREPPGWDRPDPRTVSNLVCDEPALIPNLKLATAFLWQWGQFIDHDITLTDQVLLEPMPIPVPMGDPFFDPDSTGSAEIEFFRTLWESTTGSFPGNPRQHPNLLTAFIDGSQVYGSDPVRAAALRTNDGTGRLKTGPGDLLPFNLEGLPNFPDRRPDMFLAGDIRANEQLALTAMHTLFVREHNRLADRIGAGHPGWSGDRVYEVARALVGAEIQVITYNEFLPALLGADALAPYRGYDRSVNPGIANLFATSAYRLGHSLLNTTLLRLDRHGNEIAAGHLELKDAFFVPKRLIDEGGIEPLLRGLVAQPAMRIDPFITGAVRNFLFGPPGAGGFDLAALNLQRGRDHGLPDYNSARVALGLPARSSFEAISSDPEIRQRLQNAYGDVWSIDAWVGGLAEDPVPGALVGELIMTVVVDQFERLRDGDRFWYERVFHGPELRRLERTTLGRVIRRNTTIGGELPRDVILPSP